VRRRGRCTSITSAFGPRALASRRFSGVVFQSVVRLSQSMWCKMAALLRQLDLSQGAGLLAPLSRCGFKNAFAHIRQWPTERPLGNGDIVDVLEARKAATD